MADRNQRGGPERFEAERRRSRQAEQFDPVEHNWRELEHGQRQMGESWRDDDRDPYSAAHRHGHDRDHWRSRPHAQGGRIRGAGSRLAANHGEWRDDYGGWDYDDGERGWFDRAADSVASFFGDEEADRRIGRDHRGHGPAGYTRSDERIREDANDRLTDDWRVDARGITVAVSNGEVTLDGTVPGKAHKRRAEDIVDELSGVKHVQNNLRVRERSGPEGESAAV